MITIAGGILLALGLWWIARVVWEMFVCFIEDREWGYALGLTVFVLVALLVLGVVLS